jgi:hypothetical protein
VKKRFALLIGSLGSGTSLLFRQLAEHPQVAACRVKEPRFFTDDRKWERGLDFYRSLWDFREPDERIALEASADYARHPQVPCPAPRIAQVPTGFRFLYLLRDPLERIETHHALARASGHCSTSLAGGVPREILDASRYAAQLEAYRAHFAAGDFLLLSYEELVRDPGALLRRACRFLEIDPYFAFPEPPGGRRAQAARAPAARRGWLAKLWRRARREAPTPAPQQAGRERLSAEQRAHCLAELRGDLARLARDWHFDTSGWKLR